MYSLRLLLDLVPELLVEQRPLPGAGGVAASEPLGDRLARRGDRRAARQSRRSVPALSLPHHHELRQGLPEEPQSLRGDRRTQAEDGRAADLSSIGRRGQTKREPGRQEDARLTPDNDPLQPPFGTFAPT